MTKCIFTYIKNEHRYLEQWIEYHIRLGFNYFIIYEDNGSMSHENIVNKYNKVVNIDFYDYVLNKDNFESKEIICFKHILENYNNIDWLINLSINEYITLPENMTIDDLLYNLKPDIKQIIIRWKLYNANGFINNPGDDYYLIDTYIDPIDINNFAIYYNTNVTITKDNYNKGKAFINYRKFKNDINNDINNLNIDFPYIYYNYPIENTIYLNRIFINYYITKSFEEFYERLKYNDMKIGDFFVLNPDMIDKIPEIESKYNINVFTA